MKITKFCFILFVLFFYNFSFAQQNPPVITETQVFLPVDSSGMGLLMPSYTQLTCGLGVSTDPQNVLYIKNPTVFWNSPNIFTLKADSFIDSTTGTAKVYNNLSISGTISVQNHGIKFSLSSVLPNNFDMMCANSFSNNITSVLTSHITPSNYNTYNEDPNNLKCLEIQGNNLMLVYDSNGSTNIVPHPYEFCAPTSQGGMLLYSNGSGPSSSNLQTSQNQIQEPPLDLSTKGEGLSVACPKTGCGFKELIDLVNKVLNFILFKLAIPIGAIMFCYAGFLLITSGGDTEARGTAKKIALGVVKGLVFAAAAWLIVHLILDTLGYDGSWIGF
jgi:hypothetical protein